MDSTTQTITTTADDLPRRDLDAVLRYLADTQLPLSTYSAACGERQYYHGQITRERTPTGSVRTTHLTADLSGYVYLTRQGIRVLAAQARERWPNRVALMAARQRRRSENLA